MCGLLSEHEKNKYSFTTLCWGCPLQLLFDKFSAKMYSWGFRNPPFHILGLHSQHPSPSWGFLASDTSALENLRLSQFHANYLICKSTLSKKSYKMMWLWSSIWKVGETGSLFAPILRWCLAAKCFKKVT